MNSLKDGLVDPEGNGAGENEERDICQDADEAEIGQREEHAEYATENGACYLWIAPVD